MTPARGARARVKQRSYLYGRTGWSLTARKVRNRFRTPSLVIGSLGMTKKFEYFDLQLHIGFAELYVQNLPHKFKKSYGDFRNRKFTKIT